MNNIYASISSVLRDGPQGFVYHNESIKLEIVGFIEKLLDDKTDHEKLFNLLRLGYPNAKLGQKFFGQKIATEDIPDGYRGINAYSQKFENAIYALLCVIFKDANVEVLSMKLHQGDGGFDIAVLDKTSKRVLFLVDAKSGKNISSSYIDWSSIQTDGDFWLIRVAKDGKFKVGSRPKTNQIRNMGLEFFLNSIVSIYLHDCFGLSTIRKSEKTLIKNLQEISNNL